MEYDRKTNINNGDCLCVMAVLACLALHVTKSGIIPLSTCSQGRLGKNLPPPKPTARCLRKQHRVIKCMIE